MRFKVGSYLVILFLFSPLKAIITQDTASSNALSGITLLSNSLADFALSPNIANSGISFSANIPFGMADCAVYSLNTATQIKSFFLSTGIAHLDQGDYRNQDYFLGLAFHYKHLRLGYTEHLQYEKISTGNSYHTWLSNVALTYSCPEYGAEIKSLHLTSSDEEWHISAMVKIIDEVYGAGSYVYVPDNDDNYRIATSIQLNEPLSLLMSWQNLPSQFGLGIKLKIKRGELTYAVRTHPELNLSQSLDLGFNW
ncbi:MAG: hypothetical protein LHW61_06490 [Candidatus Cloacimonetes bacterium]|nr:hypothetical protein [Candidatus Cloacimonadota bacterium]MCB5258652.1 hypothetical protein [Candidatus Cloacimonadota bacterium]